MKNAMTKFLSLFALASALCFGQTVTLSTTTLGAAVTTTTQTTITLASTSTMQAAGVTNQYNTFMYVDFECMAVVSVPTSTTVVVKRGGQSSCTGAGGRPQLHNSGATVYFGNTTTFANPSYNIVAGRLFSNGSIPNGAEVSGSCTTATELVLPKIYTFTGDILQCGSSGQWIKIGSGTQTTIGDSIRAFCTGTVGSAATDYLVGAACSSSTSSTARYIVKGNGTLYGFNAFSSAAFVGTGSSTFTVLKNGTATAIVCAPTATATTCVDNTHSVAVAAGDAITISFLSATSDTAANLSISLGIY
jgi:hypothetical protein